MVLVGNKSTVQYRTEMVTKVVIRCLHFFFSGEGQLQEEAITCDECHSPCLPEHDWLCM